MASGSLLDGLRFQRFLADEESTGQTASLTEGRFGIPRYNGDPSRLNEWIFRSRTLERKEKSLVDTEQKKLGPLTLRLIECFSGQALIIAQGLDMAKLEKAEDGLDYLIESLTVELRPRRLQQARELYEAGAQTGGLLARQPSESMGQFVLRRRAWYRAMVDLNKELKLPDLILSEQLLNNAGLSHDQKLMIRTAIGGDMKFDRVAEELVAQHPHIHDRALQHPGHQRRPYGDQRGHQAGQRPGYGKGAGYHKPGFSGKPRFHAYNAELEDPDYTDETYQETAEYQDETAHGYYGQEEADRQPVRDWNLCRGVLCLPHRGRP